jgi:hypothetical protein
MALKVERVVDGGVHGKKLLGGASFAFCSLGVALPDANIRAVSGGSSDRRPTTLGMPRPGTARTTGAPVDWPQLGRTHETVAYRIHSAPAKSRTNLYRLGQRIPERATLDSWGEKGAIYPLSSSIRPG